MIEPLLKITSIPMKYEYDIQPAKLEMRSEPKIPLARVMTSQPQLRVHAEYTTVNIDTYQARASLGQYNSRDFANTQAQRGRQQVLGSIAQAAQLGWDISDNYQKGVSISQLVGQRMMQQPDMVMCFLPQGGAQLTWNPAVCDIQYQPGDVQYQWQRPETSYEYTPAQIDMKILQYPSIQVEYLGSPNYVPPSAAPDYVEE